MRITPCLVAAVCLLVGPVRAETLVTVTHGATVTTAHFDDAHLCAEARSMVLNDGMSLEQKAKADAEWEAAVREYQEKVEKGRAAWQAGHKDHSATSDELREHCESGWMGPRSCRTAWELEDGYANLDDGRVTYLYSPKGFGYGYDFKMVTSETPRYAECFGDAGGKQ